MALKRHVDENGMVCYSGTNYGHARFERMCVLNIQGVEHTAGYMSYSFRWYIFDAVSGNDRGSVSRELFELLFQRHVVAELALDVNRTC